MTNNRINIFKKPFIYYFLFLMLGNFLPVSTHWTYTIVFLGLVVHPFDMLFPLPFSASSVRHYIHPGSGHTPLE